VLGPGFISGAPGWDRFLVANNWEWFLRIDLVRMDESGQPRFYNI
jgi:hypothetical protein